MKENNTNINNNGFTKEKVIMTNNLAVSKI